LYQFPVATLFESEAALQPSERCKQVGSPRLGTERKKKGAEAPV